jgi:hypothetical protein
MFGKKPDNAPPTALPGRNDPCHCGSGKKYKKCCQEKDAEARHATLEKQWTEAEKAAAKKAEEEKKAEGKRAEEEKRAAEEKKKAEEKKAAEGKKEEGAKNVAKALKCKNCGTEMKPDSTFCVSCGQRVLH